MAFILLQMPNIRDVAKLAGVAPITASRAINNLGCVSKETLERVKAAADELGYVPNCIARSLRSRRTNTIGLILTDITNPFWTTVARGVEDVASDSGYNVIFCNTDESETKQREQVRVLLQKRVDGFLLVPARSASEDIIFIQRQNVPVVVLDRKVPVDVDIVRADSEDGAYQLIKHLVELGHRRIAALGGPKGLSVVSDRISGYRRALMEAGIDIDDSLIFYGEFKRTAGYDMARQALAVYPRPTALFAINNFIAIGALNALYDIGFRVPEDIAVVGFDDLPESLTVNPFLTAAVQPAYDMGRRAAELLLARLSDPKDRVYQEIVLPTTLAVRRSSGMPIKL